MADSRTRGQKATGEQIEQAVTDYNGGDSLWTAARAHGVGFYSLRKALVARKIRIRGRGEHHPPHNFNATPEVLDRAVTDYQAGMSLDATRKKYHIKQTILRAELVRRGILVRGKNDYGPTNQNATPAILEEAVAHYEVGNPLTKVAEWYKIGADTLKQEIIRRGIPVRNGKHDRLPPHGLAFRKCVVCKTVKFLGDFRENERLPAGRAYCCKACPSENNYDERKIQKRCRRYGLTESEFWQMLEDQDGRCCICRDELRIASYGENDKTGLHIDHDHKTNKVRGLLCGNCNVGIGHLRHDLDILQSAIEYMQRTS